MDISFTRWNRFIPDIRLALYRFPLAAFCIIAATLLMLVQIHDIGELEKETLVKLYYSFLFGALLLVSEKLLAESRQWALKSHLMAILFCLSLIIIFVWFILDRATPIVYVFFAVAVLLSLMFSPFIRHAGTSATVWYFNYQTATAVFFAAIAVTILGGGLSLILASIDYLFEIDIPSKLYADGWALSWGLLFSFYVLANMGQGFDDDETSCTFPKGINFTANYILIPLMYVYMAILYIYFFKIILQWELPRGNLGWMITSFGTIGIITKLVIYPIRDSGSRLLQLFDNYYYYALIVPVILLAVSISARIEDYGMTEQRYAVILLNVWFFSIAMIGIFYKQNFHIKYVPIILAILSFFASFGPWGAFQISINNQVARFETLLNKHDLIKNNQYIRADNALPFDDRKTLSSIADYIGKNDNRLTHIHTKIQNLLGDAEINKLGSNKYDAGSNLMKLMGIEYVRSGQNRQNANNTFHYEQALDFDHNFIAISGYDYIGHDIFYAYNRKQHLKTYTLQHNKQIRNVSIELTNSSFSIDLDDKDKVVFDLDLLLQSLQLDKKIVKKVDADKLTLNQTSKKQGLQARLIIKEIMGKLNQDNKANIGRLNFIVLLKFKE